MAIKYIKMLCLATIFTMSHSIFELEIGKEDDTYLPTSWKKNPKSPEPNSTSHKIKMLPVEKLSRSAKEEIVKNLSTNNKKNKAIIKTKSLELIRLAKTNARPEEIEKLLDQGADINFKDVEGKTALHWAATYAHFKVVEALIYQGADIHAQDYTGSTPLHAVSKHLTPRPKEREKIIKLLFQFGASIYDKDFQDRDVLEISDGHALQRYLFRTSLKYYGKKMKPAELQKEI